MIIVKSFAQIKELIGIVNEIEIDGESIEVSAFKKQIAQNFPVIQHLIDNCRLSNDELMYTNESFIMNGSVVYIIPPSSGG
jgi:molybdopterin converting factor small subunit